MYKPKLDALTARLEAVLATLDKLIAEDDGVLTPLFREAAAVIRELWLELRVMLKEHPEPQRRGPGR